MTPDLTTVSFVVLNILCVIEYYDPVLEWSRKIWDVIALKLGWGSGRTQSEIQGLLEGTTTSHSNGRVMNQQS